LDRNLCPYRQQSELSEPGRSPLDVGAPGTETDLVYNTGWTMVYAHLDGSRPMTATELAAQAKAMERNEAQQNRSSKYNDVSDINGNSPSAASTIADSTTAIVDGDVSASNPSHHSGCECTGTPSASGHAAKRKREGYGVQETQPSTADVRVDTRPLTAIEAANLEIRKGLAYRGRDKVLSWSASSTPKCTCKSGGCAGQTDSATEEESSGQEEYGNGTREKPVVVD
jgi:hypothetical protein